MKLYFKVWVTPTPESKPVFVGSTESFEYPAENGNFQMPETVAFERWRLTNNWKEIHPNQVETAVFEYKLYRVLEKA